MQQCLAIDWSSTTPDDLVTIDFISPRGDISIDHWLYIMIINSNVLQLSGPQPDGFVKIDLISPRGDISIDHWLCIMIIKSNV